MLNFLNNNNGVLILVEGFSVIASVAAVVVALFLSLRTQRQYTKSLEPQLSMRLEKYDLKLYLTVRNTGRTAAQDLRINIKSIKNNGAEGIANNNILSQSCELYPDETIQAMVAVSGENMSTGTLYPKLTIDVSYLIYRTIIRKNYARTITFSKVYDSKIYADVNMDLKNAESSLKATARAAVRTANYLDGNQVLVFDELNILAGKSLQNDMCSALASAEKETIKDRKSTIEDSIANLIKGGENK